MPRSTVAANGPIAQADYREPRGGALCLDFVNTIDRHGPGAVPTFDYLAPGYANLLAWSAFVGVVDTRVVTSLRRLARKQGREAAAVRRRAVQLREAIATIIQTIRLGSDQDAAPQDAVAILETEVAAARAHQKLKLQDARVVALLGEGTELDMLLWPVALSALEVLGSDAANRIGQCAADDCDWFFLDTSKNRSRRYCSASGCGNATRIRRFRARNAQPV
ncbi:MAG: CGNR zinc finger domain-containing protein [Thermomicrobiales bacterium]